MRSLEIDPDSCCCPNYFLDSQYYGLVRRLRDRDCPTAGLPYRRHRRGYPLGAGLVACLSTWGEEVEAGQRLPS